MKPEDFKFDLLEHAYALRYQSMAQSTAHRLDPKTCTWVITYDAWRGFMRSADILTGADIDFQKNRKRLFGLPVRVTIDDEDGTPPIQLLMEPMLSPKMGRLIS